MRSLPFEGVNDYWPGPAPDGVYFDMDGVLADLFGHLPAAAPEHSSLILKPWPECSPSERSGRNGAWKSVCSIPGFWLSIPPTPEAAELVETAQALGMPLYVLTAVPRALQDADPSGSLARSCAMQKKQWIDAFFPGAFSGFCAAQAASQKSLCASPRSVLVDDARENCLAWAAAGGISVFAKDRPGALQSLRGFAAQGRPPSFAQ